MIAFIIVLYKTPITELERLKKEILRIGLKNYKIYFVDNTENNKGYAYGINKGLRQAIKDGINLFIVANPDISLIHLPASPAGRPASLEDKRGVNWVEPSRHFDVWGLAMEQKNTVYYGGEIDRWRMSGGLIDKKPGQRFIKTDFISGSLMVIKKEVIDKIGFFDEKYFMYYEDVDYCLRAKKAGFRVGIDSFSTYKHFENSKNSFKKSYLLEKNRWLILLKYGTVKQKIYELIRLPKTFLEKFGQSNFIINFLGLNFSSLLNRFFSFILFIFLVRYLSIKEYGIYILVWAHIGILSPLLDFGTTTYGLAFSQKSKSNKFDSFFSLRILLSIIVFILTIVLSLLFHYEKNVINFVFLTSFIVFANMLSGTFLIISSLRGKLIIPSVVSVLFNFLMIISLIFGLVIFKQIQLVFLTIFCFYNLYSILNIFLIKKSIGKIKLNFNTAQWIDILKKSVIFLLIGFFAGLYNKIDVFLLNYLKSTGDVGVYSSGYKFYEALIFIAASYNVISLPIFARLKKNKSRLKFKIKKDILFLLFIGFCTAILFYFLAPSILPLILKGEYYKSIFIARIVIFALPFVLLTSVFLNLIYVYKKAHLVVYTFIFTTLINLILNYLLIPKYSYVASAYITVFSEMLNLFILFLIGIKIYKKS